MNRRLNVRMLLRVGLALAVGFVLLHGLHLVQVGRHAANFRRQGLQAAEQGDFALSARCYNHYLTLRPDDLEVQAQYGHSLARLATTLGTRWRAYHALDKMLRRDPRNTELRQDMGGIAVQLGRFQDAIRILEPLRNSKVDRAELEETLAGCYILVGDKLNAVTCYRNAIEASPTRLTTYDLLARFLNRQHQLPTADGVMADMIRANPKSATALVTRARFREQTNRFLQAEEDFEQARKLAPDDVNVCLEFANFQRRRGRLHQARLLLERAIEVRRPDDFRPLLLLSRVERDLGDEAAARAVLKRLDHPQTTALLAGLEAARGADDEAKRLVGQLPEHSPWRDYVEAARALHNRDWLAALRKLETLTVALADVPTWPEQVDLLLVRCHAATGDAVREHEAAARAVALDGGWRLARMAEARTLNLLGRSEEACQRWIKLMDEPGPPVAGWTGWIRARIQRHLQIRAGDGDWIEIEGLLDRAAKEGADAVEVALLRGQVMVLRERAQAARTFLHGEARRLESPAELVAAEAEATALATGFAEALKVLGDRDDGPARVTRLRFVQNAGNRVPGASELLRHNGKDAESLPGAQAAAVLRALTATQMTRGDLRAAYEACLRWCRVAPYELDCWRARLELALSLGHGDDLSAIIAGLRRLEGDGGLRWRAVEAFRHLSTLQTAGDNADAVVRYCRRLLGEAETLGRTSTSGLGLVKLVEGRLDEAVGQMDAAVSFYIGALDQGERREGDVLRLVQLLRDRQQGAEASRVLRQCEQFGLTEAIAATRPDTVVLFPPPGAPRELPLGLARLGAEVHLEQREFNRAVTLAVQAVTTSPASHLDALWLADVYDQAGQSAQAVTILEKLVERQPELPEGWVALVRQLVKARQRDRAEDVLVKAQKQLSAGGEFWQLSLAQCFEALGKVDQAEGYYEQARKAMPESPLVLRPLARFYLANDRPEDALPLLRTLMRSPYTSRDHAVWARRMWALVPFQLLTLNRQLSDPPSEQALEELLAYNGDSVTDRRIRALVKGVQPAQAPEALKLFQKTITQAPLSPDEQFRLAQLCDLAGDAKQGDDLMKQLLERHPLTGQYLAGQVRRLLTRGDNGEARVYLNWLQQSEPNAKRTQRLQALSGL